MATLQELTARYQALVQERAVLSARYNAGETFLLADIQQINSELSSIVQQINLAESVGSIASAGNLVKDDAQATVPNSRTQSPESGPLLLNDNGRIESAPDTNSSTNALPSVSLEDEDAGLNAPVRKIEETQNTSLGDNEQGGPLLLNPELDGRDDFSGAMRIDINGVGGLPGAGATSDDAGSSRLTRSEIDAIFNEQKIVAQPNVLDQYASYTYQASVYLCNEASYNNLMRSKKKSVDGLQLLFQTGGASQIGRSQYFSNDYYIDKIEIKSKMIGKGTGMSHNAADIKINVIEPYGITLVDNIDRAVQSYLGGQEQKKKNFTAAIYLLAIRFYGYDAQGNLVRGGVGLNNATAVTDRNAFVEKFFPFCLANINFKVSTKAVEYQLECKPVPNIINASSNRGTIPYNIELSGQTLKDLLAGPAVYSAGQAAVAAGSNIPGITVDDNGVPLLEADQNLGAPPKADAAPTAKATVRQGLMAAMNEYQAQMVREGQYQIADEYSVEFVNSAIENARITKSGTIVKKNTPMSTSANAADQKLGNKQSTDNASRIIPVSAGMQIVQFLDQAIRNSTFMEDQQVLKYNEQTQEELATGTPAKNLAWFKVTMQSEIKGYDYKRNDYAYRVKYILHAYKITNVNSKYYPIPQFNGVHKQYNYWFTGQNTAVLSYEENLNTLYKAVLTGGVNNISSSASELIKYNVETRSSESAQGAKGKANEPPANLAEMLYSPSDLKRCNMTIVGDPAWLQQGEAFAAFPRTQWNFNAFLEDGTINIDSQQPMFEIAFNKPADYNLNTGLMDPNQQNQATLDQTAKAGAAQISRIYIATECTSMFDKGKFTQQLQGTLMVLDPKRIQQDNEAISLAAGQIALQNFSLNRVLNSTISGALSSIPFLSNLPAVQGILNQGSTLAVNLGIGALNNVLGSAPTRASTPPFVPTSFGLSVGTPTLNTINTGTPTLVIPQSALNQAVDIGPAPPQQMAAGDDAGGPELLNREE